MPGSSLYGKGTTRGTQPDGTVGYPTEPKLQNFDDWLKTRTKKASKPKNKGTVNSVNA